MDGSDTLVHVYVLVAVHLLWDPDEHDHHNMWNPMLGLLCHVQVCVFMESYFDEVVLERTALSCHFAHDLLCEEANSTTVHFRGSLSRHHSPFGVPVQAILCDCRESSRIKIWHLFLLPVNGQVFAGTYPDFSFSR